MNYSTSSFPYENRWKMSSSISQMVPGVSSWAGTSPRSHSGSSSAGTLHHQGLALKLAHRNPNEGILRKALWGGDTWSQFRCSGDSASGVQGVDARRLCSVSLTKCTHETNTFQAGARRMALAYFLTAQGEGRQLNGCHGSFSHHLEMCSREKIVTSDYTYRGFANLTLPVLNFYCRHRSFSVREESFLHDEKGKYNKWMLQKCCYLLLWNRLKLSITW